MADRDRIEHLWTILCKGVAKDERGLSIIGLVDMVHVPALPADRQIDFDCYVLSYWRRNFGEGTTIQQRLSFRYEDDGTRWVIEGEDQIVLLTRHLFCAIRPVHRLPIGGHGQHMFVVQRKDTPEAEWIDAPPTAGLWVASDEMVSKIPPLRQEAANVETSSVGETTGKRNAP
jgi:hypothetical protein